MLASEDSERVKTATLSIKFNYRVASSQFNGEMQGAKEEPAAQYWLHTSAQQLVSRLHSQVN